MKKLSTLFVSVIVTLLSCSKNNDNPSPNNSAGTADSVTINGVVYPVVKIGNQSWTAVNYNGPGGVFNTGNTLQTPLDGKLYTPVEAMQISSPAGWRVPTYNDYVNLLIARGATKNDDGTYTAGLNVAQSLMSATGWSEGGGNNYSKFNALPTGFYHLDTYFGTGNGASFLLSATPRAEPDFAFTIGPGPNGQPFIYLGIALIDGDRCSLRFVKDN